MFAGLAALFSVLGLFFPVFLYVVPVPIGVLTYRQGMQVGAAAAAAASAVSLFVNVVAFVWVVLVLALGLTLGGGLREGVKPVTLLIVGTVVAVIINATFFYVLRGWFGTSPIDGVLAEWEKLLGPEGGEYLQDVREQVRTLFPGTLVIMSAVLAFINLWGIQRILAGRGTKTPTLPPFRTWRAPAPFALAFLAAQGLELMPLPDAAAAVVANVYLVLFWLFSVFGLAIAAFLLYRWGLNPAVALAGLLGGLMALFFVLPAVALLLSSVLQAGIVLFGLIDSGFNLRRRMKSE